MGAADVVPGVSGGTIAFITGIYGRLIRAISAFDFGVLNSVLRGELAVAWRHVDATFLVVLFSGIGLSIYSLARLISYLLETQTLLLWAFFFGLILASSLVLLRRVVQWTILRISVLVAAALFAGGLGLLPPGSLPATPPGFFLAGFVAICAMILPGISGSFILLMLGMYEPVIGAIKSLSLLPLSVFTAGNICGLLAFSRLLRWLLERHAQVTMAALTGFLFGSLLVVWPWKLADADSTQSVPISPARYGLEVGDSQLLLCGVLATAALLLVWLLETRWGGTER